MAGGMEWRPTPDQRQQHRGRRHSDDIKERVATMEARLEGVEKKIDEIDEKLDKTDSSIVRLHERIDELNGKLLQFSESVHTRVADVIQDVEKSIDDHCKDEERILDAKFNVLLAKMDQVASDGKTRGDEAMERQKILVRVLIGAASVAAPVIGYFGAKIFDSLPKIIVLLDKLEKMQ
jgi:archaellum component FlaC